MPRFPLAAALVAAAVALAPAQPGPAAKRQGLKEAADDIAAAVKAAAAAQKQTVVRLGEFAPVGFNGEDASPAIRHELRAALAGILDPKATLELSGEYSHAAAGGLDGKAIAVVARVTDTGTGQVVKEGGTSVLFVRDVTRFTGPNGVIAPGGLATKARASLDELLTKPTAVVAKGLVAPSEKSEFAVEILARAADGSTTPRPAKMVDGVPFVELAPADVVEIRVLNHSKEDAVGRVAIDGLDLFAFDPKGAGHAPLPPAKDGRMGGVTIPGWPTGMDPVTKQLTFADITPAGYAALADKPRGKVGMISVAVSRGAAADEPPTEFVTIRFRRAAK